MASADEPTFPPGRADESAESPKGERGRRDIGASTDSAQSALNSELSEAEECLRLLDRVWRPQGPTETNEARAVPERIGRFVVERVLGYGGFGIVYLAVDPLLDRPIAVKVPRLHTLATPELHERFLQEARAAAGLEHPNIVPVYESGELGPLCYIASAYCPGQNLADWMDGRAEPVPVKQAVELAAVLAEAMEYSHTRGVVHRDLKPGNVMLVPRSDATQVESEDQNELPFVPRITDFGLAKLLEASLGDTRSSMIMGSPLYAAPEQIDNRHNDVGPATDVYALGVMLYELLAGRPPFEGTTLLEIVDQVRGQQPPPIRALRSGVPRELETICLKCLQKDPRHRYGSAGEMAADLRRYLRGEPIAGRRPGLFARGFNWCRRPERVRDAGIMMIAVNAVVTLWVLVDAVLAISVLPMPPEQVRGVVWDSVGIIVLHAPLFWVGAKIIRGSPRMLALGTLASIVLLMNAVASLAGLSPLVEDSFGGTYRDPLLRTIVFCLLSSLFTVQTAACIIAMGARRR